jgi:hypothetical protein
MSFSPAVDRIETSLDQSVLCTRTGEVNGVKSNRAAIGVRVTARFGGKMQEQEALSQSSFYSASYSRLHFGLARAATADLDIRWPSGAKETVNKGRGADHLWWFGWERGGQWMLKRPRRSWKNTSAPDRDILPRGALVSQVR